MLLTFRSAPNGNPSTFTATFSSLASACTGHNRHAGYRVSLRLCMAHLLLGEFGLQEQMRKFQLYFRRDTAARPVAHTLDGTWLVQDAHQLGGFGRAAVEVDQVSIRMSVVGHMGSNLPILNTMFNDLINMMCINSPFILATIRP